jgi:hypothetical protein
MPHDDLDEFLAIQGGGSSHPQPPDDDVEPRWGCDNTLKFSESRDEPRRERSALAKLSNGGGNGPPIDDFGSLIAHCNAGNERSERPADRPTKSLLRAIQFSN